MKRILIISNNYPPTICGVGDYSYGLALEFAKASYNVHVICKSQLDIRQSADIHVHPIVENWTIGGAKTVLKVVRNINPDVILLQYVPNLYSKIALPFNFLYFVFLIQKRKIPIITMFHEVSYRLNPSNAKSYFIAQLQRIIALLICKYSNSIITSIEYYEKKLKKLTYKKVAVIPIGSPIIELFDNHAYQIELRKSICKADEIIIATFGVRNFSILIDATKQLISKGSKIKLLICGKINDEAIIAENDFIKSTGILSLTDIGKHLSIADIFVMPDEVKNNFEGGTCNKSGSLAAAFQFGLPIIGFKGDMTNDLLVDGENIILCEEYKSSVLAANIHKLIIDKNLKQTISSGAKLTFAKYFAQKRIFNAYSNIVAEINKKSNPNI
ncbi:MAG: glycosyltransferase family 4 protein [Bacteroidia bacterium]